MDRLVLDAAEVPATPTPDQIWNLDPYLRGLKSQASELEPTGLPLGLKTWILHGTVQKGTSRQPLCRGLLGVVMLGSSL